MRHMLFGWVWVIACAGPAMGITQPFNVTWTSLGLDGQTVQAVAVAPQWPSDTALFAAGYSGGNNIFRSLDGARTWETIPIGVSSFAASHILVPPTYRTGSGDQTVIAAGTDVVLSANGGSTWARPALPAPGLSGLMSHAIAASPNYAADHQLFAASNSGILKSNDGGLSFLKSNMGLTATNTNSLVMSPSFAKDSTIFVGTTNSPAGIFRSTDAGQTWAPAGTGLPSSPPPIRGVRVQRLFISPAFESDQTLFAKLDNELDFYRSTDAGATWSAFTTPPDQLANGVMLFSPDFATDRTILRLGGTQVMYGSTDAGETWVRLPGAPYFPQSFTPSPNFSQDHTFFVGTLYGLYSLTVPEPGISIPLICILLTTLRRGRRFLIT